MYKRTYAETRNAILGMTINQLFLWKSEAEEQYWLAECARCSLADDGESCLCTVIAAKAARHEVNLARVSLVLAYCEQYRIDPNCQSLMALVEAHHHAVSDAAARGEPVEPSAGILGIVNDLIGACA